MKVMNAHITWNSLPTSCEFLASSAEVFVEGLGSITIRDFISEELRNRLHEDIVAKVQDTVNKAYENVKVL